MYARLGHRAHDSILLINEDHRFVINDQDRTSERESDFTGLSGSMALAASVKWAIRGLAASSSSPNWAD